MRGQKRSADSAPRSTTPAANSINQPNSENIV
jgi:hypothetical protein